MTEVVASDLILLGGRGEGGGGGDFQQLARRRWRQQLRSAHARAGTGRGIGPISDEDIPF